MQVSEGQQVQIVQAAAAQGQAQTAQAQGQTMQVMQQIITNTGEIQQIPVRNGIELGGRIGGGIGDGGWMRERMDELRLNQKNVCFHRPGVWHCILAQT